MRWPEGHAKFLADAHQGRRSRTTSRHRRSKTPLAMGHFVKENTGMLGRRTRPTPAVAMAAGLALLLTVVLALSPSTTAARTIDDPLLAGPSRGAWHLKLLR